MPQFPVLSEPRDCLAFARDTWALEEAARIGDEGRFLYVDDVAVLDAPFKVAPRLSALDHLTPESPRTQAWWDARRREQRIDDALRGEMRVFADPQFARDASDEQRLVSQLKRHRERDEQPWAARKFGRADAFSERNGDLYAPLDAAPAPAPAAATKCCQIVIKGTCASGASVVWRVEGYMPFFYVLVDSLGLGEAHMRALHSALLGACRLDAPEQLQIEPVLGPRLVPFAFDPEHPDRPKDLLWWRLSFATVDAKKRAAKFLMNRDQWGQCVQLSALPQRLRQFGFYLAEHRFDESTMVQKTLQINVNQWLTIAHAPGLHGARAVPEAQRFSLAQFEWLLEGVHCLGIYRVEPEMALTPARAPASWARGAPPARATMLEYDRARFHAPTVWPIDIADWRQRAVLRSSTWIPPKVDATVDIEVAGSLQDASIFPEPQHEPYAAYLVVTILSFKGSVPSVWRDRGVEKPNEPFAVLVHACCDWSRAATLELREEDVMRSRVYACVEPDEARMLERWSDWVFRVGMCDILSQFNGDKFDLPYILCRLTGNPMRPSDGFRRTMRASRFPWMSTIWSLPTSPYWKRVRARDKRSAELVGGDEAADESGGESEEEFADEDNLLETDQADRPREDEEVDEQTQFDMILRTFGVAQLDLMKFVKEIYKSFEEYSLNYLAGVKLKNVAKDDVKPAEITQAWHSRDHALLERVVSYCVRDVVITVMLDGAFQAFMTLNALAQAYSTPLSSLMTSGSQKRLMNCLVQFSAARGFVCNGFRETQFASSGKFEGGKVQDAVPGVFKATCVDFASLYPSIMQCKNLCYSTYVPPQIVSKLSEAQRAALKLEAFEPRPGVVYHFVQSYIGVVPNMLAYFVAERRSVQAQMKVAEAAGDMALRNILDMRQLAIKICANATYGFTGVGRDKGAMLGMQAISETTTYLGRSAISKCAEWITEPVYMDYVRDKAPELFAQIPPDTRVWIVYGDTDSLFFNYTYDFPMPLMFALGDVGGEYLTAKVRATYPRYTDEANNPFKVEHEKSGLGLFIRKKMYAMMKFEKPAQCEEWERTGLAHDAKGNKIGPMIRGLKPTRRDTPALLRTKGKQILGEMLRWVPYDAAAGRSREAHLRWVVEQNVAVVLDTIQGTIRTILESHTRDQARRAELAKLFFQTGELKAAYAPGVAVAPHMAVGWKFRYDFGARVPFLHCTEPDIARLERKDGKHDPRSLAPKYSLGAYGVSGYDSRDFTKPYKSLYGKAAYARHPTEEYAREGSALQLHRSHYLQQFASMVEIIFVKGIPGADRVPGLFAAARRRIHEETMGLAQIETGARRARALFAPRAAVRAEHAAHAAHAEQAEHAKHAAPLDAVAASVPSEAVAASAPSEAVAPSVNDVPRVPVAAVRKRAEGVAALGAEARQVRRMPGAKK